MDAEEKERRQDDALKRKLMNFTLPSAYRRASVMSRPSIDANSAASASTRASDSASVRAKRPRPMSPMIALRLNSRYANSREKRVDNFKGKVVFFVIYFMCTALIVLFFSFTPFAGRMDTVRAVDCAAIAE